jgi:hypothetical protein
LLFGLAVQNLHVATSDLTGRNVRLLYYNFYFSFILIPFVIVTSRKLEGSNNLFNCIFHDKTSNGHPLDAVPTLFRCVYINQAGRNTAVVLNPPLSGTSIATPSRQNTQNTAHAAQTLRLSQIQPFHCGLARRRAASRATPLSPHVAHALETVAPPARSLWAAAAPSTSSLDP